MRAPFFVSWALLAGCNFGSSQNPLCTGYDEELHASKAAIDELMDPAWVPQAPPAYRWYCISETDYADRDADQEARLEEFKAEFLQTEIVALGELMRSIAQGMTAPCNLISQTEADQQTTRAKKLVADRLTASLKLVQRLGAPEKYDFYWASIVTAVKVARQLELLGAEYDVLPTVQAMLAEQIDYYLNTELRMKHDLRYSPKALVKLLKAYDLLGGDVIDISTLGPRMAKALRFEYQWSQETRLFPNGELTQCNSEIQGGQPLEVKHTWVTDRFVQSPLEYPATLSSMIMTSVGNGTHVSPATYRSDLYLSPRACEAPPRFHITMTRWGPDTQSYNYVDSMGQTDTRTQTRTCHTTALVAMQLLNLVDYDLEAQPAWKKYAFMDEVWVMKPPLRNLQEQVVDETWNQTASGLETSVSVRLQVWHRPEAQ